MNRPIALTVDLLLGASAYSPAHSPAPAPTIASPDSLPNDAKWVRTSAEYRALIRDFPKLTQAARGDTTALAEFAERFFIIPNPMYGSWEHVH